MTKAVLPAMRQQGSARIVNISSVMGLIPAPFWALYSASKHALEGYSESLDHEIRGFGVKAILVEPGFMKTAFDKNSSQAAQSLEAYAQVRDRVAAGINASVR